MTADPSILGERVLDILVSDIGRWYLLSRAATTTVKAQAMKVEWIVELTTACRACGQPHVTREAEFNYMQVVRTVFKKDETETEALERHLDSIETIFRTGMRVHDLARGYSAMGGVLALLGRWPRKTDRLELHVLRAPRFRTETQDRYGVLLDTPRKEWLTELTLLARKGE